MNNLLQHLWEQYRGKLYPVSYRILLNRQDSEDAVSEAFLKLSENIDRYSELDDNQLLALLTTITKNIARDKLKLRREAVSGHDSPTDKRSAGRVDRLPPHRLYNRLLDGDFEKDEIIKIAESVK